MAFYKKILAENLDGVAQFVGRMVIHKGDFHVEQLHVVELKGERPIIRNGCPEDKKSRFTVSTGGEVVNSFSPLYEVGYFFSCLFLAGIGTAILKKDLISKYKHTNRRELLKVIKTDLAALKEKEIFEGMKNPVIGIISNMDTDVVPLRYNKHQLWRLDPFVLTKRVAEIKPHEYGKQLATPVNQDYWTEKDQQIADIAMESSTSIQHAKIVQYYLVLKIFFGELGINIKNVPIFFNFVPKEEILVNGSTNSLLKALIGMHTPETRIKYRIITGNNKPWILTKACPRCGQGDKRILASKLMGDGVTVKVHCKPHAFEFKNEQGEGSLMKGCNYEFSFKVPTTAEGLYDFFRNEDFSIHFAARELLTILKDCVATPLALVVGDLGITRKTKRKLIKDPDKSKGYGDNLEMLTSSLALQHFFIKEKIAGDVAHNLNRHDLNMRKPILLLGYDRPTLLTDPEVTVLGQTGKPLGVSDTSALKALERGLTAKQMFKMAIRIHSFTLNELLGLRGKSFASIQKRIAQVNSDYEKNHNLVSGKVVQIKSKRFLEFVK